MSALTIENDLVHYEVLGRGRPVIMIHGWLGSWRYWIPTMQQLSMKYRIYALDLWGFGDSEKDVAKYGFASQVQLLIDFMDKLGITKAALVGHALGAAIAIDFARKYPDRAPRVMLVSPPLFDMGGLGAPPAAANIPATLSTGTLAAVVPPLAQSAENKVVVPSAPETATPAPASVPAPINSAPQPAAPPTNPPTAPASTTPPSSLPPANSGPHSTATEPNTDTLRHNPFRENPELLAQIQGLPATPKPASAATTTAPTASSATTPAPTPAPAVATATAAPPSPASVAAVASEKLPAVAPAAPSTPSPAPTTPAAVPLTAPPAATAAPAPTPTPAPPSAPLPAAPKVDAPNPLVSLLSSVKPKALLERQLARTDENLEKLRAEVDKMDENVLTRSAQSFAGVNLALELHHLTIPVLLLHGKDDPFLPPPDDDLIGRIAAGKADGLFLPFVAPEFRHFPMLESTTQFNRLLMDFLDAPDLSNVQLKETWRRQLR